MSISFSKTETQIIKGVAILMMIILHAGGSGGEYDVPVKLMSEYPVVNLFHPALKLCVGMFTFMIGYGYAFAKVKDWRYSVKHIWSLLKVFWLILLVITVPAVALSGNFGYIKDNGIGDFLQNLVGVSESLNWYSWFVYIYIYSMILLPFLSRWIDRKPIVATISLIGISYLLEVAIHTSFPDFAERPWIHSLFFFFEMFPTVLLGYFFSKERIFQKIPVPSSFGIIPVSIVTFILVIFVRSKIGNILGFSLDFVYAPIAIFAILCISNVGKCKALSTVLIALGKASVYMWFFHALFFTTPVRPVFQRFIMISDNVWLITLWTIVLTYICSWALMKSVDFLSSRINSLIVAKH